MHTPIITGSGVFTPENVITNAELVVSFNAAYEEEIVKGDIAAKTHSNADFIRDASGIEQRYVIDKEGILDPTRMTPRLNTRPDDAPSLMAEMGIDAIHKALAQAGRDPADIDLILCAASNHERAYPAIAVEMQQLLGASGFAYDMNVACSSATFGLQTAADMVRTGSVKCAVVVSPEVCSAHLEWRDRDCHFIFGDVATAILIEPEADGMAGFRVLSTRCATKFSNNIRNNDGYLRRAHDQMEDRRDMQFMQEGRKVFKEVLPMVARHITSHLHDESLDANDLKRLWLHQANKTMNDYIGKKVLGREPTEGEQPNILQDCANTSSAGSIIAFSKFSQDLEAGDLGLLCSFGAGYSVGSAVLERVGSIP